MPTTTKTDAPDFARLLDQAITEPGIVNRAYFAFHGYSLGNQLLAMFQCAARGIELGPIASFNRWKELGRHVTKGQKAIELCMPVTSKRTSETTDAAGNPTTEEHVYTRFVFRRNWFVLSQTEGAPYVPPALPDWNQAHALAALELAEQPFTLTDGNCQGYASGRTIAVSPVAADPLKTWFHEAAHILLGHTAEGEMRDDERTPRTIREVEAESVAMLCCAALNLPGVEYSRGYIQHWNQSGQAIPERSAQKIFKVADQILRAGREETT
jgi:antirestriction protein ArdC